MTGKEKGLFLRQRGQILGNKNGTADAQSQEGMGVDQYQSA